MDFLQPPGWVRARGYSNGIAASGRSVHVSGMIGWDGECQFHTDDFAGQVRQALENVVAVLADGGARPEHIGRMTWYVLDKKEYLTAYPVIGAVYREVLGGSLPTMTGGYVGVC